MGQDVRQDWAITLEAMHALMQLFEAEWSKTLRWEQREPIASAVAYALIAFCGSFRGNEVFLTDLLGLRKYLGVTARENYIIIPLLGRFKGEQHTRYHLAPMASETSSGLKIRVWITRLVEVREQAHQLQGPAFQDRSGNIVGTGVIEGFLMEALQTIKNSQPGVIPEEVDCYEDFGVSRSFRRGATSTARVRGVNDKQIDLINRWRKFEGARRRMPALPMQDHYSDIKILIPEMVKFSQAL